jgi:hypothetical protein
MDFGYDKERFVSSNAADFECMICSCIAYKPMECSKCGHVFCEPCISSWLKKKNTCPISCKVDNSILPVGLALKKIYNSLQIQCSNHSECRKVVSLCDLEKHEKFCQLPQCSNFEHCGMKVEMQNKCCSQECEIFLKIKSAQNDEKAVFEILRQYFNQNPLQKSQDSKKKTFGWDPSQCGDNIIVDNEGNFFVKETQYAFRTVLANKSFTEGKHYWEITGSELNQHEIKIGVTTKNDINLNSAFCDIESGFAYYGLGQLRNGSNANGKGFGKKMKKTDTLGLYLNMDKGTLSLSLNGEFLGVAFQSEKLKQGPVWPAVSILHCAGGKLVTGLQTPEIFKD